MDFALTEELEILRKMVRDFANDQIGPHVEEWDEKHYLPYEEAIKPMMAVIKSKGIDTVEVLNWNMCSDGYERLS